jgi:predicted anti-sigma-YlaC factor YlaD
VSSCTTTRDRLSAFLEGDLEAGAAASMREHLASCDDCRELADAMAWTTATPGCLAGLEPPDDLADRIAVSPCSRWLGLLFQAVDREISEHNLDRLLQHLEACPGCRRTWNDLSLIHQVSEAIVPPTGLAARIIDHREVRQRPRVIGQRFALAAAYVLAVLTSLVAGTSVNARRPAIEAVQQVAASFSDEIAEVKRGGRGEARVMLWRALEWGEKQAETLSALIAPKPQVDSERDNRSREGENDERH